LGCAAGEATFACLCYWSGNQLRPLLTCFLASKTYSDTAHGESSTDSTKTRSIAITDSTKTRST
jgi:hypothetical protein